MPQIDVFRLSRPFHICKRESESSVVRTSNHIVSGIEQLAEGWRQERSKEGRLETTNAHKRTVGQIVGRVYTARA